MNRLNQNPLITLVCILITLTSVPLSFYLFFAAERSPRLMYAVAPVRSVLAHANEEQGLKVLYRDRAVTKGDVVVVQVAIWNEGRAPIRPEMVLEPIRIRLGPGASLLSSEVAEASRPLSALALVPDPAEPDPSSVGVTWRILEHRDGARIQIVYAGSQEARVVVEGAVEGQRAIEGALSKKDPRRPEWLGAFLMLLLGVALTGGPLHLIIGDWRKRPRDKVTFLVRSLFCAIGVTMVATSLLVLSFLLGPDAPFGV